MNGAAGELHSVFEGLFLCLRARERRQERWVDVQDAVAKLAHEIRAQHAHETCQAHHLDLALLQHGHQLAVIRFALFALGRNQAAVEAHLASSRETRGIFAIADHNRNSGRKLAGLDVPSDGLEIRAAAREQDSQVLHRSI